MPKVRSALLTLVLMTSVGLAGCSLFEKREGMFEGRVAFGFEEASFTPCGDSESWWLGGGEAAAELQARYAELALDEYAPAFARVEAQISGRGEYGQFGAYERQIEIVEVLDVRALSGSECE